MATKEQKSNLIADAISRRIDTVKSEIRLYVLMSFLIFGIGATITVVVFLYLKDDETEIVKQFIGIGTGALTTGLGGALVKRILDLRSWIATGNDWNESYQLAVGPPPDRLLHSIEEKILDWLEGR